MRQEKYELDGEVVTLHEIHERARAYADRVSPCPSWDPMQAGITGLFLVGIVLSAFMGFARLDAEQFGFAVGVTSALGFIVPYFYFRTGHSRHSRESAEQFQSLLSRATRHEIGYESESSKAP